MSEEQIATQLVALQATVAFVAEVHRLAHFVFGIGLAWLMFRLCGFGNSVWLTERNGSV